MSADCQLEQWYDAHAQALFGFLLNMTRSEVETRDILQEVFRKLVSRPTLMTAARDPRAYLLRLAHNVAVDRLRRCASREQTVEALAGDTADLFAKTPDPDAAVFREELAAALAALPEEQRAVVHLKLWENLTFNAIAGVLDIPPNTAASRYRYGIDKLRGQLRPLYEEIT